MNEREIKAKDVRVGDTIKYSKTARVIRKGLVYCDLDNLMTITTEDFDIELLNRPLPKHKYAVGQKVTIGGITAYITEQGFDTATHINDEPIYKLGGVNRSYAESELTPVEEEVWEPKVLDYVCYKGERHILLQKHRSVTDPYEIYGEDNVRHLVVKFELSPWKEAQP
jgi:hypothetical protein